MKLYLTSNGIPNPNDLESLLGKPIGESHMGLIINAKDYYSTNARNFKVQKGVEYFESFGFRVSVIDLKDFSDADSVFERLKDLDTVWGYGGNTFCLRYEMKRSGFDEAIHKLLDRGVIFGGESAGAIVAGKTLKGTEVADLPEAADEIIWDGLGLVDNVFMPHADNPMYTECTEHMRSLYGDDEKYIEIGEDDSFVVHI